MGEVSTPTLSASILAQVMHAPSWSLAIVADGQLSVAALEAVWLRDPTYRLAARTRGVDQLRQALLRFAPMVVVVESRWSGWRQSLEPLDWPARLLLLLDPEDDPAQFVQSVRAGADGYLSRTAPRERFAAAVDALRQGGSYLDPMLARQVQRAVTDSVSGVSAPRSGLSRREHDILVGVASGRSSKEIAQEFAIAPKTVCNHVNNIYQKLNLRHRGQLVLYAAQHGLTSF
jgi:DNA-binding NarL/FixJ family response regulator